MWQHPSDRPWANNHKVELVRTSIALCNGRNSAGRFLRRSGEAGTVTGHGCTGNEIFEVAGTAIAPILIAKGLVEAMGVGAAERTG